MGLIPDIANARDAANGWRKKFYTVLALGWQGTDRQWRHFSMAYLLLAGLATPLVISVHSAWCPGTSRWRNCRDGTARSSRPTSSPARFSRAVAMVLTLLIPMRRMLSIEDLLTDVAFRQPRQGHPAHFADRHYSYITETFMVWYWRSVREMTFHMRYFGPWGPLFWMMVLCNCMIPLCFFLRASGSTWSRCG